MLSSIYLEESQKGKKNLQTKKPLIFSSIFLTCIFFSPSSSRTANLR